MKACCVQGCGGPTTPNPVFFEFPCSRLLRKRWLDAINSTSVEADAVVCDLHFARGDLNRVGGHTWLKSRVIPSRRMGGETDDEDSDSESSDSTGSVASDKRQDKTTNVNKDIKDNIESHENNGKVHNDNGNFVENCENSNIINKQENDQANENNSSNGIVNDNRIENQETEKESEDSKKEKDERGKIYNSNEKVDNGSEKVDNSNEQVDNGSEKVDNSNEKVDNDNEKGDLGDEKVDNGNKKVGNGDEKVDNDSEKVDNVNGKIDKHNGKVYNDNGKKAKTARARKTRCKITAMRAINGRRRRIMSTDSSSVASSSDSVVTSAPLSSRVELEASKEDIEESLQFYFIENKKTERQVAAMTDVLLEEQERRDEEMRRLMEAEGQDEDTLEPSAPTFIELSVGQDGKASSRETAESDCMMLLENVQCDVDPSILLAVREEEEANMEQVDLDDDADDEDEPEIIEKKKQDPISLLTSSDEDDVILQEPKIDTVEVSSADTSEDDMPLVKLVKPSSQTSNPMTAKRAKNLISKLIWGRNDFYCMHCRFTTSNASEYSKHMSTHSKIIQLCHDCGFTTCSKHQMQRHKQKHKNEKRYRCQMCNYSAKHQMSLVYHMKTHNTAMNEVELAICGTYEPSSNLSEASKSSGKRKKSKKSRSSETEKKYKCNACGYKTDRSSDLKRHRRRLHEDEEDDDYVP